MSVVGSGREPLRAAAEGWVAAGAEMTPRRRLLRGREGSPPPKGTHVWHEGVGVDGGARHLDVRKHALEYKAVEEAPGGGAA